MATGFNTQVANGEYRLQFETDNKEYYLLMQETARRFVDGRPMKRYNIYYRKYNIIANAYIPYVKVVNTDDIYHEIGKTICTSLEKIESISYTEPRTSQEECEKYWADNGYRKLSDNLWVADGEREEN